MMRWGKTIIGAAASAALILGSGAVAYADDLVAEADTLQASTAPQVNLGTLACESERQVTVELFIDRGGNSNQNTLKNSSTVNFSKTSQTAVTATSPDPSSVTLPETWETELPQSDAVSSSSTSVITVDAGATNGDFTGSVAYRATGTNLNNAVITRNLTVNVSWKVENCGTTPADTTAPVVVLTCPDGPVSRGTAAYATWTATDEAGGSGLATPPSGQIELQTATLGAKTAIALAGTAVDGEGNTSAEVSCGYTVVDTTPPVVVLICPDGPVTRGLPAVATWEATDEAGGSGLAGPSSGSIDLDTSTLGDKIATAGLGTARDIAGNLSVAVTCGYTVVDRTPPTVVLSCPTAPVVLGSAATASWTASDEQYGSGLASQPSGTISLDTSGVGANTATVPAGTAVDVAGNESVEATCPYSVIYAWDGFFRPVDMDGVVNSVKAGSAVPMKFSLDGDQGLGIVAAGWPKITFAECGVATVDPIESTVTAGSSSLSYDALADQYVYVWKTDKSWAGKCGTFSLKLVDGTTHSALFKFLK